MLQRANGEVISDTKYGYNGQEHLSSIRERIFGGEYNTTLSYDWDNRPTEIRYGSADHRLRYTYDGQGRPSVFKYNGGWYSYLYNLQGDVIAILDNTGNIVVEYKYDAWGATLAKTGSMAGTLGVHNPFRYRGYVFDLDTGLYYLKSRYYNPKWGRFINADVLLGKRGALPSHNLFAYCYNNCVKRADYHGYEPGDLFDSMDDAAKDFAYRMNPISIQEKVEYASIIYKEETVVTKRFLFWTWSEPVVKYTYTQPLKGETTSVDPRLDPMFEKGSALVHTHGAFKYVGDNCENFSPDDKRFKWSYGLVVYVATPNGKLKKYDRKWDEIETVVCEDIPYDP